MRINPKDILACACYLKRVNHSVRLVREKEIKIFGFIFQEKSEYMMYRGFPSIEVKNTYHEASICYYFPHVEIETSSGVRTVWFEDEKEYIDYYNSISKDFLTIN